MGRTIRAAGEWFGPCPNCGGRDRFSVNTKKQVFNCRGCGGKNHPQIGAAGRRRTGGDVIALARLIYRCDFATAIERLTGETIFLPVVANAQPSRDQSRSDSSDNLERAHKLWHEAVPLPGTLGERYFVQHRELAISELGSLNHALRYHANIRAVVALMTDPATNQPSGIHRTFLNPDGSNQKKPNGKNDRRMLGTVGIIRLSPDENVHEGLGLVEGIEDGLAVPRGMRDDRQRR
jgi:hypothetical protein